MASQEEIAKLKADWLRDPCWDIEETEGFELHRKELLEFRIDEDAKSMARLNAEKISDLEKLNPVKMLQIITSLQETVQDLKSRIEQLEANADPGFGPR